MQRRAGRSILLIDIALPRDIDPSVIDLPGVHLYNLDDLQAGVDEGIRLRLQEVEQVQAIIAGEVRTFDRWVHSLSVVDTIGDLRQHVNVLRQQELARTLQRLRLSGREAAAIEELTTRLMNKLLHIPTLRLKEAAAEGNGHEYAGALRYLFDLGEQTDETPDHRNTSQQAGDDTDAVGSRALEGARSSAPDSDRANSHHG